MDKDRVLEGIDNSFSDVPYPAGKDFFKAIADRDYEEFLPSDEEKKWIDITEKDLKKYYDFIFFLDPEGVIYYLPAYMKLIVQDDEVADHQCAESLFMAIAKLESNKLSQMQRETVLDFLAYCRDVIDPKIDLDTVLMQKAIEHLVGE